MLFSNDSIYPHTKRAYNIFMFVMYILRSLQDNDLYIGSTSDLMRRLREHNAGLVKATKHRTPFKLVYAEAYADEGEARHREQNLKLHGRARRQLFDRIKKSLRA